MGDKLFYFLDVVIPPLPLFISNNELLTCSGFSFSFIAHLEISSSLQLEQQCLSLPSSLRNLKIRPMT